MTVSNTTRRTSAVGTNTIGQEISFSFPIKTSADLVVITRVILTGVPTVLTETTNYTVNISGDNGGTVIMVTAVAVTSEIHVIRDTSATQSLDLVHGGSFGAEDVEEGFDKITRLIIENKDDISRVLRFPNTDPIVSLAEMSNAVDRASKMSTYDVVGAPVASETVPEGITTFSPFGKSMAGTANAASGRTLLELSSTDDVEHADIKVKSPWFDVRAYGAGTSESPATNATAIQAAIDAAELVGGTVYIPPGEYLIDTQINITGQMSLMGIGATLKQDDAKNITNVLRLNSYTDDLYIRIKVDGNKNNNTTVTGVELHNVVNSYTNISIAATECDVGMNITGETEANTFFFYVQNCAIGVQQKQTTGVDISADENTIFITGKQCDTFFRIETPIDGGSAHVHFSCEAATEDAIVITSDSLANLTLSGTIRGCAKNGLADYSTPSAGDTGVKLTFNNLWLTSAKDDYYGILITNNNYISGDVVIYGFGGALWIKEADKGSLGITMQAVRNLDGIKLGDASGGTTVKGFAIKSGSIAYTNTGDYGLNLDNADNCMCDMNFVHGSTDHVNFSSGSTNNTVSVSSMRNARSKYNDDGSNNILIFAGGDNATGTRTGLFTDALATPSVLGYETFLTGTTGVTITALYNGYQGEVVTIISKGAIIFDTTSNARLVGSSVDITTASGDVTQWVCETAGTTASVWRLVAFFEVSANNSTGA